MFSAVDTQTLLTLEGDILNFKSNNQSNRPYYFKRIIIIISYHTKASIALCNKFGITTRTFRSYSDYVFNITPSECMKQRIINTIKLNIAAELIRRGVNV